MLGDTNTVRAIGFHHGSDVYIVFGLRQTFCLRYKCAAAPFAKNRLLKTKE